MPTPYQDGEFHTINIRQFVEDVKKATGGQLDITVHSNGSLIKHPDILRAVEKGWYSAVWPMVLVNDDPMSLTFTGACEDVAALLGVDHSVLDGYVLEDGGSEITELNVQPGRWRVSFGKALRSPAEAAGLGIDTPATTWLSMERIG